MEEYKFFKRFWAVYKRFVESEKTDADMLRFRDELGQIADDYSGTERDDLFGKWMILAYVYWLKRRKK